LIVEDDDAELRSLMAALFEDEELDTIECEKRRGCACNAADRRA
jgi:hypothetical protein